MTTATILDKGFNNGRAEFQVEISDGVNSVKKSYSIVTLESLKMAIATDIKNFNENKSFIDSIPLGALDTTVSGLTPEQIKQLIVKSQNEPAVNE